MSALVILVTAVIVATLVSAANVIVFVLSSLMRPRGLWTGTALLVSGIAIAGTATAALVVAIRTSGRNTVTVTILIVATLVSGFFPRIVDSLERHTYTAWRARERARARDDLVAELAAHRVEVERRIATGTPYTAEEADDFLWHVMWSDLRYYGLPDRSAEAQALLERALKARLIDPNVRHDQEGPYRGERLFVRFYRIRIATAESLIPVHEWEILELLVANGADLDADEARPVRNALAKTKIVSGDTLRLQ